MEKSWFNIVFFFFWYWNAIGWFTIVLYIFLYWKSIGLALVSVAFCLGKDGSLCWNSVGRYWVNIVFLFWNSIGKELD